MGDAFLAAGDFQENAIIVLAPAQAGFGEGLGKRGGVGFLGFGQGAVNVEDQGVDVPGITDRGSGRRGGADRGDVGGVGVAPALEHRRARHQGVGAGCCQLAGVPGGHPAIDLDAD